MLGDTQFLRTARAAFNPFVPSSGTEHVALLLYSITRMLKPRNLVEYGSGYTTLFLLRALADNVLDFAEEAESLRAKTTAAMDVRTRRDQDETSSEAWFKDGNKACGVYPGFYLRGYEPHLYSFEKLPPEHNYARKMMTVVDQLKLSNLFTHITGHKFLVDALPACAFPIDLAWNDDDSYREFFDAFWPRLNPQGGLMIFHNTVSFEESWNTIESLKHERATEGVLELLTLPEPHKMNQNSCTILRRNTEYRPPFFTATNQERILTELMEFMEQKSVKS